MKILVTGADGFIGSHLVEELVKKGKNVKAFCNYNSFGKHGWIETIDKKVVKDIEIISGDVRDSWCIQKNMKGCDKVFHLAALIGIPYSYLATSEYVETNIKGTLNILQSARDIGNVRVIQTSTSEVYGSAKIVPITEEHPLQAQSPYAATKIAADSLAMSFFLSFDTAVSIARPFNTYGPRQSTRAIIPTIISQVISNKKIIKLGSVFPKRDFNYVTDVAKGFIAIGESNKAIGEIINIGSNFEISISDVVKEVQKQLGTKIKVITDKQRLRPKKSEVDRLFASNKKIKKITNWKPEFLGKEGFKKGINKTITWFRKNYKNNLNNKYHI